MQHAEFEAVQGQPASRGWIRIDYYGDGVVR